MKNQDENGFIAKDQPQIDDYLIDNKHDPLFANKNSDEFLLKINDLYSINKYS